MAAREDLTSAQQVEHFLEKLRASEVRFQNLADNIPGMIYQFRLAPDGSTSTPYVSSGCYELYELAPEDVMAGLHSLYALHHPEDHPIVEQAMIHSAQTLTPFECEWRIILPSGKVKWIQSSARPERQSDGSIMWDGVVLDISDRKESEKAVQQKSAALQQTLQELQQAQLHIVQSEKMSALGNLVAGVAHEINNPVGFIAGNLAPAHEYVTDLIELINLYQAKMPQPDAEIERFITEIDLDYVRHDLPKLLDSMKLGVQRIRDISTSLRTFSRADKDYKVPFNLHEGIDSTILILKHRLKAANNRPEIKVVKNYGKLPPVECFAGQLNQVFMNLLANAIDAIEEGLGSDHSVSKKTPIITITTIMRDPSHVAIQIADNGIGISEAVQQQIFEHLFTTKPVGKGTGLGLAITRQIVIEKHGGTIEVNSSLGQGTEFVIVLAVKASQEASIPSPVSTTN